MRSGTRESRLGVAYAVLYACFALIAVSSPHFVHDEGLLMYGFARSLSEAFLPCLFFQKVKPALALFYAPAAWFGLTYYLVLHVLVAAATLYWTNAVARSLHHKRSWPPVLVIGFSPLFFWSTSTGISNSDGVAATALFFYLLETRKNLFAAGFVLGVLPWIRYEQALFSAVLAPWVLYRSRSPKFLAGLVTWPIAYLGSGAIYHRDPLWFLHFLPNVSNLDSGNEAWIAEFAHHDLRTALMALLMVSPAVFVLTLLRRERLRPVERLLAVFTAGFFVLFVVTHLSPRDIGPAFTLGFSSRYALVPLVPVALLFGRVVEQQQYSFVPRLRDTIVAAGWLMGGWFVRTISVLPLLVSAALGVFVAAMRARLQKTAGVALFVACLVLILHDDRDEMSRSLDYGDTSAQLIAKWLVSQPVRGEIYTNHQLLRPYMVRTDHLLASRVKFMLAADHHFELVHLSNPANGQRAAVLDAIPRSVFGAVVYPEELDPGRVRPGTWFVLINDVRTKQIMPLERWKSRLKPIKETASFHVYELLP